MSRRRKIWTEEEVEEGENGHDDDEDEEDEEWKSVEDEEEDGDEEFYEEQRKEMIPSRRVEIVYEAGQNFSTTDENASNSNIEDVAPVEAFEPEDLKNKSIPKNDGKSKTRDRIKPNPADPAVVPKSGTFFLHDDRETETRKPRRVTVTTTIKGSLESRPGREAVGEKPDSRRRDREESLWKHDKFQELDEEEQGAGRVEGDRRGSGRGGNRVASDRNASRNPGYSASGAGGDGASRGTRGRASVSASGLSQRPPRQRGGRGSEQDADGGRGRGGMSRRGPPALPGGQSQSSMGAVGLEGPTVVNVRGGRPTTIHYPRQKTQNQMQTSSSSAENEWGQATGVGGGTDLKLKASAPEFRPPSQQPQQYSRKGGRGRGTHSQPYSSQPFAQYSMDSMGASGQYSVVAAGVGTDREGGKTRSKGPSGSASGDEDYSSASMSMPISAPPGFAYIQGSQQGGGVAGVPVPLMYNGAVNVNNGLITVTQAGGTSWYQSAPVPGMYMQAPGEYGQVGQVGVGMTPYYVQPPGFTGVQGMGVNQASTMTALDANAKTFNPSAYQQQWT